MHHCPSLGDRRKACPRGSAISPTQDSVETKPQVGIALCRENSNNALPEMDQESLLDETMSYAATAKRSERIERALMYWSMLPCYTMFRSTHAVSTEAIQEFQRCDGPRFGLRVQDTTKVHVFHSCVTRVDYSMRVHCIK